MKKNIFIKFHSLPLAAVFTAFILFGPASGHASSAKKEPEIKKDEAAWVVPSHIQLTPMMLPVRNRQAAPVTIYLEAIDKKYVGKICNYAPRIRDALLQVISRDPIPVKNRMLDLRDLPGLILNPINKAVGARYIKHIFVVAGVVKMGGGSISKLPFARINGCKSIRQAEAARIKAKAEKEKKEH